MTPDELAGLIEGRGRNATMPFFVSKEEGTEIAAMLRRLATAEADADLIYTAWTVIANAGWDDCAKSSGWQEAAIAWRDRFHARLALRSEP